MNLGPNHERCDHSAGHRLELLSPEELLQEAIEAHKNGEEKEEDPKQVMCEGFLGRARLMESCARRGGPRRGPLANRGRAREGQPSRGGGQRK